MIYDSLVWLGCGDIVEPMQLPAKKVMLVDAQKAVINDLITKLKGSNSVDLMHACVSVTSETREFYRYSLSEFSALSPVSGLTMLFPGIRLEQTETTGTLAVADYVSNLKLSPKGSHKLVIGIIDVSLQLLKALADKSLLQQFSVVEVQCSVQSLYQNAADSHSIKQYMSEHGYDLYEEINTDPDLPRLSFKFNTLWPKLKQTEQQLQNSANMLLEQKLESEQKFADFEQQIVNIVSENETLQQQLRAANLAAEKNLVAEKKLIDLNNKLANMDVEFKRVLHHLDNARQKSDAATEKLAQQNENLVGDNTRLTAQLQVYQQWQAAQNQQIETVRQEMITELKKSLNNSVKQMEAFIGLRDLLGFGQMPLNYHGWPISADIGLYLAKKVVTEPFEYIIEFGSGTSTVLFAKALQARAKQGAKDYGCKIISFEHNKTYLQKTAADLTAHQVEQLVELVYAPLVELQCDDSSYLYYSCDEKLAQISQHLKSKEARILVLVDGPPANTGPMARYPAIPQILKYLARHQLHIVMDDYVREDEKKAAAKWSKLFEERGIKHHKELLNFEKVGFSWILNN